MIPPAIDRWDAWTPEKLASRLGRFRGDWYVAGGWALDLWHGLQRREHEDLEFVVRLEHIEECRKHLSDLEFFAAQAGSLTHLTAKEAMPEDLWQLWGADPTAKCWRVDMMVERGTQDVWVYKRQPSICLPRTAAIRWTPVGIPYLAPAIVLLFKAKYRRDKDEKDFRAALPKLEAAEKAALRDCLQQIHPNHEWISALNLADT